MEFVVEQMLRLLRLTEACSVQMEECLQRSALHTCLGNFLGFGSISSHGKRRFVC